MTEVTVSTAGARDEEGPGGDDGGGEEEGDGTGWRRGCGETVIKSVEIIHGSIRHTHTEKYIPVFFSSELEREGAGAAAATGGSTTGLAARGEAERETEGAVEDTRPAAEGTKTAVKGTGGAAVVLGGGGNDSATAPSIEGRSGERSGCDGPDIAAIIGEGEEEG